jgi:hypothetical protein
VLVLLAGCAAFGILSARGLTPDFGREIAFFLDPSYLFVLSGQARMCSDPLFDGHIPSGSLIPPPKDEALQERGTHPDAAFIGTAARRNVLLARIRLHTRGFKNSKINIDVDLRKT